MEAVWVGRPVMTVEIHSYKRDMAVVLWMRLVSGSTSFLPRRGSRGIRAPN